MWKKGPMPTGTWNWGGIVLVGDDPLLGFYFADFCGDHVMVDRGKGQEKIPADQVALYNNCIELPTNQGKRL